MIATQVARIGRGLVDVGLRWLGLALELDDDDTTRDEEHRVRPPELHRQLVLENGGVTAGEAVAQQDLADLALKRRDGLVPGLDLFW